MNFGQRFHRWYLVLGLAACTVYLALPPSSAAQCLFLVIALSAPAVGILGIVDDRPNPRAGWWLLCAGFAIAGLAEVADFVVVTMSVRTDLEAVIQVVFLTAYIVQLCGLMTIVQARSVSKHQFGWFDATAVGVCVFTVIWSTLYEAIFRHNTSSPLSWLTRFGGGVLGVALVVMALRLVISQRSVRSGFGLLLMGFFLQTATDSIAALFEGYAPGGPIDTMWALGYVLVGAALIHPGRLTEPRRAPSRLAQQEITHTLVLQVAVMVLLVVVAVIQFAHAVPTVNLTVWTCAWLAILMMTGARIFGLLRMVGHASATENQRRLTAMVGNSNDVIGLADPDRTIRYLTPSVERITGVPADAWIGERFDEMLSRHVDGLDDLLLRSWSLRPGEVATWEGAIASINGDIPRTIKVTLANQLETPEVNGWVISAHDITDEARLTAELRHQTLHDTLTGLPNRALLFDRIQHSLDRASRTADARIAVVLVDLDDFKAVNDSLGHTTGDELLQAVAGRLSAAVRPGDTVARLGGDEFALLLEDTDDDETMRLARQVMESLTLPIRIGTGDFAVRASVGVACHSGAAADPVELLRSADIAMYASKRDGKSRVTLFHDDMHERARDQLELRMDLTTALQRDQLFVVYQPIIDTNEHQVVGVEALVRWAHPTRGLVSPAEFIPVAEQSGQIGAIGEWVLTTACIEAAGWNSPQGAPYISVNVSAAQLSDQRFVEIVIGALRRSCLPSGRLMLEITESMLVDDSYHARQVLTKLRDLGVRIAIDDFGTGYSSLAYLRELSVDVVKIDQSFVRDLGNNTDHQALTRTILALARGLDMTAIAEGVETEGEFAELSRLGCGFAQGYLFSRPVAPDVLSALINSSPVASHHPVDDSPRAVVVSDPGAVAALRV